MNWYELRFESPVGDVISSISTKILLICAIIRNKMRKRKSFDLDFAPKNSIVFMPLTAVSARFNAAPEEHNF